VEQVGILLVDDDVTSQRALKSVLDSEGWRVRIVPKAGEALAELATGTWNLAIVNVALAEPNGPLFAILRELAQAQSQAEPASPAEPPSPTLDGPNGTPRKRIQVLFLVPLLLAESVQPILEREGLPHSPKPYHLHDFLERVSELLLESGAITEPIRGVGGFSERKVRRREQRFGRGTRAGAMFASREDYHMTEEEMAEYERQEEEQRKKRQKNQPNGPVI
jgi:CheY-like chemotaxis protein